MPRCKICLNNFNTLYFDTGRMRICRTCINTLNDYQGTADLSYQEIGQMHRRDMERKMYNDLYMDNVPELRRLRAHETQDNFEEKYEATLPSWITSLLANNSIPATNKMKKIIRAERFGLLYRKKPVRKGYPNNWENRAKNIRRKDHFKCQKCEKTDTVLHVHHIVHVKNFGAHRQNNLITLCYECHQNEHDNILSNDTDHYDITEILPETELQKHIKIEETITTEIPSHTINTNEMSPQSENLDKNLGATYVKEKINAQKETELTNKVTDNDSQLANQSPDVINIKKQPIQELEKQYREPPIPEDNQSYWNKYWFIFVIFGVIALYYYA